MLHQFSWQHFLIAASVLTLVWYLVVGLVFYRNWMLGLFSAREPVLQNSFKDSAPVSGRWEKDTALAERVAGGDLGDAELMGRAKLPEGMLLVGSADFGFVGGDREAQVGLVPDVLEEIRSVFRLLAERDGDKRDFFVLMEGVRGSFPKISSNPNIGRINEFVADHAPFHLSLEELESLWD